MTNDLISREAIAKEILPLIDPETRVYVKEKLYNTPTVEPEKAKEGELVKAYTKGFDAGVETARPQGEWITQEHSIEYYCSHCGERLDQCCENFCCHCGAKMGGTT